MIDPNGAYPITMARLRMDGLIGPDRTSRWTVFHWGDHCDDPVPWVEVNVSPSGELVVSTPDTKELVALTETPQPRGGVRTWFRCPTCDRRCDIVYWGRQRLGCHVCQRVVGPPKRPAPTKPVRGRLIQLSTIPD
jgi:hypothetical protein